MAAEDTVLADDIKLEYSANGTVWTEVVDVKDMTEPGNLARPDVDVTPLRGATARVTKQGLPAGGDFTFNQFWGDSGDRMDALQTIFASGNTYHWRITYPDGGSSYKWTGKIKEAPTSNGVGNPDDPLVIRCVVKVSTAPVWTKNT